MDQVNIGLINNWTRGQEIVCPACGKDARLCQHIAGNLPSALRREAVDTVAANLHRGAAGACSGGICTSAFPNGMPLGVPGPVTPDQIAAARRSCASNAEPYAVDMRLLQQPVAAPQVCAPCANPYPFKSRRYGNYIDEITKKGFPYVTNTQGRRCDLPPFVEARQCGESKNMMRRRQYDDMTQKYIYERKSGLTPQVMPRGPAPVINQSLTQRLDSYDLYGYGNDFSAAQNVSKDDSFESPYRDVYISDRAIDKITGTRESFGTGTVVDSTRSKWQYTPKFI